MGNFPSGNLRRREAGRAFRPACALQATFAAKTETFNTPSID
jgi:hypothetical protein